MPKAFLLKYKKRCEYFGSRSSDDLEGCETPVEAVNLKKMETNLNPKILQLQLNWEKGR